MHSSLFIFIASFLSLFLVAITPASAQQPQKILIVGDSLSAAYNIKIQSSWPALLQNKFDQMSMSVKITNASISGETTFGGKNRINALLKQHQPTFVIIELGGNDGLRGLNMNISQSNLIAMIQATKNSGAQVLLIGVRLPPNLGKRYNQKFQSVYQSVAQQEEVFYLEQFLAGVAEHKQLMQNDGIHPVAKAQPILQDKVFKALLKTGLF